MPRAKARVEVPLCQFKITLKRSKPPIWRRVVVRSDTPLSTFHDIIQVAMGWHDCHLHQFFVSKPPDAPRYTADFGEMYGGDLDESRYSVSTIAPAPKAKFIYEYDFGDSWMHEVILEKLLPADPSFTHPVCLGGDQSCPLEDSGGLNGYYRMLEILALPKHPEHRETLEWAGSKHPGIKFDLDKINAILKRLKV